MCTALEFVIWCLSLKLSFTGHLSHTERQAHPGCAVLVWALMRAGQCCEGADAKEQQVGSLAATRGLFAEPGGA